MSPRRVTGIKGVVPAPGDERWAALTLEIEGRPVSVPFTQEQLVELGGFAIELACRAKPPAEGWIGALEVVALDLGVRPEGIALNLQIPTGPILPFRLDTEAAGSLLQALLTALGPPPPAPTTKTH